MAKTDSSAPAHLCTAVLEPKTAPCAGCRERFPRRELVTVHEGHHGGVIVFDGDDLCRQCARRNAVEF